LQLTQAPRQPTLQHTPSVQKPDAQSVSFEQTAPRGFGPQLPFTHLTPATQSPSERQVTVQVLLPVSQLNGLQIVAGPGRQRPSPSQTLMSTMADPSQRPGLHDVPAGWLRHAPPPLHVPSNPHEDAAEAAHVPSRGLTPSGTNAHVPSDPGTLHALHVSLHALPQHTPSTQKPLAQSASQPHAVPLTLLVAPPSLPQATRSLPASFGAPLPPPHPAMTRMSDRTAKARTTTP
jgi:hypothetical protein